MNNQLFDTTNTDPTINLAQEEALLLKPGQGPTLFLWQNAHTVVIGRGQNAWKECRVTLLQDEQGTLVRRSTGGGAVYHDLGNLNFSFVMPKGVYDVPRQLKVIQRAVAAFGVQTLASGRNDIVIAGSGEKFSGNAFRLTQTAALHHGTILMAVDMSRLGRYLAPSPEKLRAKGVESVRARVGNLLDHAPGITVAGLKAALFEAFMAEYGPAQQTPLSEALDPQQVAQLTAKYRDWEWTFGRSPQADISLYQRFPWGQVELNLSLKQGRVAEIECYTDANDPELAGRLNQALQGALFSPEALSAALAGHPAAEDQDVAAWLKSKAL